MTNIIFKISIYFLCGVGLSPPLQKHLYHTGCKAWAYFPFYISIFNLNCSFSYLIYILLVVLLIFDVEPMVDHGRDSSLYIYRRLHYPVDIGPGERLGFFLVAFSSQNFCWPVFDFSIDHYWPIFTGINSWHDRQ